MDETDRALCDYAVKLTLTPGRMSADDVEQLRTLGLSDSQITVAVQVIGYFNYINRVADGLDVETEDWICLLYTSPSPRDLSTSRMPSSA